MLAMTHHAIIQWAAFRVRSRVKTPLSRITWFTDYAVLGDDVVIANGPVAREYYTLMQELGVGIGLAKSIVGKKPVLEFAKRFIVFGQDASPISFLELASSRLALQTVSQYAEKYALSYAQVLSILDYGYKVKGGIQKNYHRLTGRISAVLWAVAIKRCEYSEWLSMVSVAPIYRLVDWSRAIQILVTRRADAIEGRVRYFRQSQKDWWKLIVPPVTGVGALRSGDNPVANPVSVLVVKALFILDSISQDVKLFREVKEWFDIYGRLDPGRFNAEARRLEDKLSQVAVPPRLDFRYEDQPDPDRGVHMDIGILRAVRRGDHE